MNDILDRLIFNEDGIYFLLDYKIKDPKQDIFYIVDKYKLKNINYLEIQKDINNKEKYTLLTKDINSININETMEIIISEDKLKAEVKFYPPLKTGNLLTTDEIVNKIFKLNIKYGLNLFNLQKFIKTRDYEKTYLIAQGLEPSKGKDGRLIYFIDIEEKKIKPKILENGNIDYKTLNLFVNVEKGMILATRISSVDGENGKNIYGEIIEKEKPLDAPKLPKGLNTEISEDGKSLISNINGCIFFRNNKIDVLPILEIKSNIDNSTGNIDFMGRVIIRGNVLTGFTVNAEGSVEVHGYVEGATIISKDDIFVAKGVHGAGKAKLVSTKDITLSFIENATIIAERNITADYIMNCNIYCNGDLTALGKRGLILGGKSIVTGDILCRYIGSEMSNNTDITLGVNYKVLQKYEIITEKLKELNERYEILEKIVDKLSKIENEYLSIDKKKLFEKSIKEKIDIKKSILNYKEIIQKLMPLFKVNNPKIEIKSKIYNGTKLRINNSIIFIKEDVGACCIKNIDGKIEVLKPRGE